MTRIPFFTKLVCTIVVGALFLGNTAQVSAQPASSPATLVNTASKTDQLKVKADKEVDRRIEALTKLSKRLESTKKLSGADKVKYTKSVSSEIKSLTELNTKIASSSDISIVRNDIKSIITSYQVFGLFVPQIQVLAAADSLQSVNEDMMALGKKIENKLIGLKATGVDTTAFEGTLKRMRDKVTNAQKHYALVASTVPVLTTEGFPGNKTTLETARKALQSGRNELGSARQDVNLLLDGLKSASMSGIKKATASATPSASASAKLATPSAKSPVR